MCKSLTLIEYFYKASYSINVFQSHYLPYCGNSYVFDILKWRYQMENNWPHLVDFYKPQTEWRCSPVDMQMNWTSIKTNLTIWSSWLMFRSGSYFIQNCKEKKIREVIFRFALETKWSHFYYILIISVTIKKLQWNLKTVINYA